MHTILFHRPIMVLSASSTASFPSIALIGIWVRCSTIILVVIIILILKPKQTIHTLTMKWHLLLHWFVIIHVQIIIRIISYGALFGILCFRFFLRSCFKVYLRLSFMNWLMLRNVICLLLSMIFLPIFVFLFLLRNPILIGFINCVITATRSLLAYSRTRVSTY